jgi:WD repeat-containing protein 45
VPLGVVSIFFTDFADSMAVALRERTCTFKLSKDNISKYLQVKTCDNPTGAHAIALFRGSVTVAFLNQQIGNVQVSKSSLDADVSQPSSFKSVTINAHQHAIQQVALNQDGSYLATASAEGTLIKVFDTLSGTGIHEFRRGSTPKAIQHLAFAWEKGDYLCCSSNPSDTVHVWRCKPMQALGNEDALKVVNTGSYFSGLSWMNSYMASQWSFAQVRV